MKPKPSKNYPYRVNTPDGVRFLNETEKNVLLDAVFSPIHEELKINPKWVVASHVISDSQLDSPENTKSA